MKGCINILGLTLFLIQIIIIINSKKSLASSLSLRSDKDEQRCGYESCYEKCPTGQCCSKLGYCGTTFEHCGYKYCKLQCPSPPSPPSPFPPPPGRCGVQAGGIKCPDGSCCGEEGWCGTTEYYCNPKRCQSQCKNRTIDDYECGHQGCYKKCPSGSCCSMWGYCGTTKGHCGKPRCQSQCPPPPPPPPPPPYAIGRCGMQAGGRKCPTGLCCSSSGWCGTTKYYCAKQWCQSQCNTITSSTMSGTETFLLDGIV